MKKRVEIRFSQWEPESTVVITRPHREKKYTPKMWSRSRLELLDDNKVLQYDHMGISDHMVYIIYTAG